jgi:hypothetical protein
VIYKCNKEKTISSTLVDGKVFKCDVCGVNLSLDQNKLELTSRGKTSKTDHSLLQLKNLGVEK